MDTGRRTPDESTRQRLFQRNTEKRLPFSNLDERSPPQRDKNVALLPGRRTPDKDPTGRMVLRGGPAETLGYRGDSDRLSPSAAQFRDYDRSPVRESSPGGRRSPVRNRLQRSPEREIVGRASYRTSPSPSNREGFLHSPYRERTRIKQQSTAGDVEETTSAATTGPQRRTGESDVRSSDNSARGAATSKSGTNRGTKETGEESTFQRTSAENKVGNHVRRLTFLTMTNTAAILGVLPSFKLH